MYKCKYCGCQYQVEPWYRREEEHSSTICPECHYKLVQMKGYGQTVKKIGTSILKSVSSFLDERKQNMAAPSARIRIYRNNDNGFDDILNLTELQWRRLTSRQLDSILSRLEDDEVPGDVTIQIMKGIAWKSDEAKDYLRVAKIYAEGRPSIGIERNITEAVEWFLKAKEAKNAETSDAWIVERIIKRNNPDAFDKAKCKRRSQRVSKLCMPPRK